MHGGSSCPLPCLKPRLRSMLEHTATCLRAEKEKCREKNMLDSLKNYRATGNLWGKGCPPPGHSGFQGTLAMRRCRAPRSQAVQLAADGARQSVGAGGGGVDCQLQSALHVWALPTWHRLPSPPLLGHSVCSAPWKLALWAKEGPVCQQTRASPCCLLPGAAWVQASRVCVGAVAWCSGVLWPSAMQVASEG